MFQEMMPYLSCLELCVSETLLLFLVTGQFFLPSVKSQACHYVLQRYDPRVRIESSPPSNTLPFGVPLNLTCIASQNDELPDKYVYLSRPVYIQWFGPQGSLKLCKADPSTDATMRCLLMVPALTLGEFGNYTCQASSNHRCSSKRTEIYPHDTQRPEFVDVPVNQTASIGSTVTFNCTVTGHPKPTITWTKNNELNWVQSSQRANTITDNDKGQSQLVITGLTSEDYGKYQCVANSSAGVKESQVAFLYPGTVAPSPSVLKLASISKAKISAIVAPSIIVVIMICGLSGFLCYLRSRRTRDAGIPLTSITCIESVERISLSCEITSSEANNTPSREDTENMFDTAEGPADSPKPFQKSQKIQLPGVEIHSEEQLLLGELTVEIPSRQFQQARQFCSIAGLGDTPPLRPQTPRRKESTKQKVLCSGAVESRSRYPKLEKSDTRNSNDSGYDSSESRENIRIDQKIANEGWEINLNRLEVKDEVLGEGQFGIVYKGQYCREDGKVIDVAVKQLKDSTSETNKADLLGEMQILKQAGRHPNIVSLVGACTQAENILVVTEFYPRGSLESLLRSKHATGDGNKYANLNCELNDRELLNIALQIASGMQHLEERKCIHRDLAARNVFIDDNKVAKVGDFGLARDISGEGIYTKTSNGKVPWRWSSLESLRDGTYTSQSDVWSFGIVSWEITTYGELPYPGIATPAALISFLSSGKRMPRPDHCTEELYVLMRSCWKEKPSRRPTFAAITNQLEKYLTKEYKRTYVNIRDDDIRSDAEFWL